MPDISMCASKQCSKSKRCYRHKNSGTTPSKFQSYLSVDSNIDYKTCGLFWDKKGEKC